MSLKKIAFVILFSGIATFGWSQPQPQNPDGDPDNPVPITGIEYLLIAGGAYGVSRIFKHRNKKNTES